MADSSVVNIEGLTADNSEESDRVDDIEYGIPKIEKPPTLESILNEPDEDVGDELSLLNETSDYVQGHDDDIHSIAADTASIASQDSFRFDTAIRRSPRKSVRYPRHGSVLRLVLLKSVSAQILSAIDRVDAGKPTALTVAVYIAVGTSHGLVLIFDPKQILKWCLGSVAVGKEYGAVSALSFNKDSTRLLCGFAKGQMTMWNLTDGKLLRTISDAHPPGSAILNVKFTDDPTLAVCSDSGGSVYLLEMKRSIAGRSCDSKCIFSGARGEVCTLEPLHMSNAQAKSHQLKDVILLAMATLSKIIVVSLKPHQRVISMFPLKGDPSTLPLVAWQFVIIQVTSSERIIDPVIAFARDKHIHFFQAVCTSTDDIRFSQLQTTELPYRLLNITWLNARTMVFLDTSEKAHVYDVRGKEELEVIDISGVELVYSTSFYKSLATGGNVSEALAFAGERSCYQSLVTYSGQYVAVGTKGVHVMTLRTWKERLDNLIKQKRFGQALQLGASFYDGTAKAIVGLGGNSKRRKQVVAAKMVDIIDQFVEFTMATFGSPVHVRQEEQEDHFKGPIPVIVQHCLKLDNLFVVANNQAMEKLVPKRGKTKRSSISKHPEIIPIREMVDKAHKEYTENTNNDNKEKWKTALQELYDAYERIREEEAMQKIEQTENAMDGQRFREAWKAVNELSGRKNAKDGQVEDLLFGRVYERFQLKPASKGVFLESLEPYILSNRLTSVTPSIMQDFVSHYQVKGLLQNVEACIVHMDIASLDIHQVFVLCWAHGLYDAILHVYNRGMKDYTTPLEELLALLTRAVTSGKQLSDDHVTLGNKILVYISCCLAGRAYPYGDIPKEDVKKVKDEVFKCVTTLHTKKHSDDEPTYPHLRTLLKYDTREFFNVLALAFEDPDMHGEGGAEKKQRVVDILLYIMVEGGQGFTPTEVGILFTFLARQMAKKDNSVMVSRALFDQVLEALCIPCEVMDFRHEERQQALMELIHAGGLVHVDEEKLITSAEKAQFFQVCETMYEKRREFDKILGCYWADPLRKQLAFHYIQRILTSSEVLEPEKESVQREALRHIKDLVEIDHRKTAQLVVIGFALELSEAVKLLEGETKVLYLFLCGVFQISERTGSSLYMDRQLQVEPYYQEYFIELMCKLEPEKVYPYLNGAEGYRLEETLQICQKYEVTYATAYIMEKTEDIEGAFGVLFQKLQNELKNTFTSGRPEGDVITDEELQTIRDLLTSVIQLCQRHCGKMEEKRREKFWFPLLDLFMETQKRSKEVDEDVKGMTTTVLNSMMSYISLPSVLQKVMQDPMYSGGQFGEIKPLLIGMLDTYNYEKTLLHTCNNLVNHDLHRHLKNLIQAVNRGIVPRSDLCNLCARKLVMGGENDNVICFRCGHSYHNTCLKSAFSFHSVDGDVVWMCHACNKSRRKDRLPSTSRFQRAISNPGTTASTSTGARNKDGHPAKPQVTLDPQQLQALDNLKKAQKTPSRLALLTALSKQDQGSSSGKSIQSGRQSIFEHQDFQLRLAPPRIQFDT